MPRTVEEILARFKEQGSVTMLVADEIAVLVKALEERSASVPMLLWCPKCGARHVDEGEFVMKLHHTHACQECGLAWRPAIVPTTGVLFLPGFKSGGVYRVLDLLNRVRAMEKNGTATRVGRWTIAEITRDERVHLFADPVFQRLATILPSELDHLVAEGSDIFVGTIANLAIFASKE